MRIEIDSKGFLYIGKDNEVDLKIHSSLAFDVLKSHLKKGDGVDFTSPNKIEWPKEVAHKERGL